MSRNNENATYNEYNDDDLRLAELEAEFRLLNIRKEKARRRSGSGRTRKRDTTSGKNRTTVKQTKRILGRDSDGKVIHQGDRVEILSKSRSTTAPLYKVKTAVAIGLDNQGWVKLEAYVNGEKREGSRVQHNIYVLDTRQNA